MTPFVCKHCFQSFSTEDRYQRHFCDKMKRAEELKSVLGQAALHYYSKWFSLQKRAVPKFDTFVKSQFFKPFMKFAHFAKAVRLADVDEYISLMIQLNYPPVMWTMEPVFALYLEHLIYNRPPIKQIELSIKTLQKMADMAECDVDKLFDTLVLNDFIDMIKQGKLTPWLMMKSIRFRVLVEQSTEEEQKILETIIKAEYWAEKFKSNPEVVEFAKKCAKALNI